MNEVHRGWRLSILTPNGRAWLLRGLSVVGWVLCFKLLLEHGLYQSGGFGGGDVYAYWIAGGHLRAGEPLYQLGIGGYAAFLYPPPLAQLFAPLSLLTFPQAAWLWRAVLFLALRIAVGSWRNAGLALLVWPPVIWELDAANVHLLLAAAVAQAIRGRSELLLPAALTKFASLAAVPLALATDRRGLLLGAAVAAGIGGASFLIAPDLWFAYLTFVVSAPGDLSGWYNIGALVPLWLRLAVAAAAALWAIRVPRMAAIAATLALPVLWLHGLSTVVAVAARPPGAPAKGRGTRPAPPA